MECYAAVRRSVYVEGLSERAAARRFGLARETVRKMLRYRLPPGYRRAKPIRCPKLDAFTGVSDQILTDDQQRQSVKGFAAEELLYYLALELNAVAAVSGHGFSSEYPHRLSILPPESVHFKGRTPQVGEIWMTVDTRGAGKRAGAAARPCSTIVRPAAALTAAESVFFG